MDHVGHAAFDVARKAIDKKLRTDPENYGDPLHHPLHGFRKLKSSHIRIVYRVKADASEVWVLMIGDRRDIWESEQKEILERDETERGRAIVGPSQDTRRKKKR